jgi:hypothetical protein
VIHGSGSYTPVTLYITIFNNIEIVCGSLPYRSLAGHNNGMDSHERRERERQLEAQISSASDRAVSNELDEQKLFSESPVDFAKRRLDEALIDAVEAMYQICKFGEDDKLRFAAAKYIMDRAFGSTSPTTGRYSEKEDDPIFNFIEKVASRVGQ